MKDKLLQILTEPLSEIAIIAKLGVQANQFPYRELRQLVREGKVIEGKIGMTKVFKAVTE